MNCLKCGCSESTKAGFTRDFQRYKCKNCGYQFTTDKPRGKPPEMKKNAILTDREIADGLILTCQAHPTSAEIYVDYDDV